MEVRRYRSADGFEPFGAWLASLRDSRTRAAVLVRIDRLSAGNYGDCKSVGHGVTELRVNHGPGYRIYCALIGRELVLLLGGGDKHRQHRDIRVAQERLDDYRNRSNS